MRTNPIRSQGGANGGDRKGDAPRTPTPSTNKGDPAVLPAAVVASILIPSVVERPTVYLSQTTAQLL